MIKNILPIACLIVLSLLNAIAYANQDTNVIGAFPEMLPVSGGPFVLGRLPEERGASDELPQHEIDLKPYAISKYEVTNGQFTAALNWALEKGYLHTNRFEPYSDYSSDVYMKGTLIKRINKDTDIVFNDGQFVTVTRDGIFMNNHPVVEVTWYGAAAYANWISEIQGLEPCYDSARLKLIEPLANGYRLPTEAEWERAAGWDEGAPNHHWVYGNGQNTLTIEHANYNLTNPLKDIGMKGFPFTTPVGYYDGNSPGTADSSSPVGCYYMSGNVFEWCQDNFYEYDSVQPNGKPKFVHREFRIVRGGSWNSVKDSCRTTNRGWSNPGMTFRTFGFRLVRSVPEN